MTDLARKPPLRRRIFLSLGTRLTVPVVLLVAAVALGAYLGITRTSRATAMRSKEVAADMVVKLTSLSVMPAVVFNDEIEIKRAVDDLARNPEVTDVELWSFEAGADTRPLASFHRPGGRAIGRPRDAARVRALDQDSVRAIEPVVGPDGRTVGLLAVRFSTAREAAALTAITRQILYVAIGLGVCLTAGILMVMARLVVSPIRRLQRQAERLTRGGAGEELELAQSNARVEDEVVRLAATFGEMAEAVRDREQRLARKNGELRLILDSVDQGFLTAEPDGRLLPERSAIVARWLGDLPDELTIWGLVERIDPASAGWAEMAWSQVTDGFLPLEVAIDQLPKRLVKGGRHFEFAYHPVLSGDSLERVVIVLTDVTAEVERQRAVAEQHEFSVLVDQFVRDRRAFLDFWREASELVRRIVAPADERPSESLRRDVHTLKGNARFFGLTRISTLCHAFEDAMRERGENVLNALEREALSDAWDSLRRRIEPIMQGATAFLEVSEDEYQRLVEALRQRQSLESIEELVVGLRLEPTAWRLGRAAEAVHTAASKLGKTPPEVAVEHNDLRVPPGRWAPFWSVFHHVIANAADHGLESDDERRQAQKPVPARVTLRTRLEGGEFSVEVADDGRGIDWDRVREAARRRNLPYTTESDLERALFSEGLSLRDRVSEVSGRGVGLAAVANVVRAMNGRIELESRLGRGTTWRFRFPAGNDGIRQSPRPTYPPKALGAV